MRFCSYWMNSRLDRPRRSCNRLCMLELTETVSSSWEPRPCFEESPCLRRFERVGGAAYDQIVVAAVYTSRFAADHPCRNVILREDQQHKIPDIRPDGGARPEGRQRLPLYSFSLLPHSPAAHAGLLISVLTVEFAPRQSLSTAFGDLALRDVGRAPITRWALAPPSINPTNTDVKGSSNSGRRVSCREGYRRTA